MVRVIDPKIGEPVYDPGCGTGGFLPQSVEHMGGPGNANIQRVIDSLKLDGRCGIVMDEGVLFRTNEKAFVQTRKKLLNDCNLWCIISLPGGVFTSAGVGVKTTRKVQKNQEFIKR